VPVPQHMAYGPMDPANDFLKRRVTYGRSVGLNGPGPGRSGATIAAINDPRIVFRQPSGVRSRAVRGIERQTPGANRRRQLSAVVRGVSQAARQNPRA